MNGSVAGAFSAEWSRQSKRWRNRVVLASVVAFPVVLTVALWISGSGTSDRVGDIPLVVTPTQSGLSVPLIALSSTMKFFLPLAVAVVAGEAISGDAASGTLRYVLAGGISRSRYLLTKSSVAGLIVLILAGALAVAAVLAGLLAFGAHPLAALNGDQASGGPALATFSVGESLGRLALSSLFVVAGMASVFAVAFFVSTLTGRVFVAVAAGAAVTVVSRVFNADYLPGVDSITHYMPNNDIDLWQHLFTNPVDSSGMSRFLLLQAGYFAVFMALSWWAFSRRDVLT